MLRNDGESAFNKALDATHHSDSSIPFPNHLLELKYLGKQKDILLVEAFIQSILDRLNIPHIRVVEDKSDGSVKKRVVTDNFFNDLREYCDKELEGYPNIEMKLYIAGGVVRVMLDNLYRFVHERHLADKAISKPKDEVSNTYQEVLDSLKESEVTDRDKEIEKLSSTKKLKDTILRSTEYHLRQSIIADKSRLAAPFVLGVGSDIDILYEANSRDGREFTREEMEKVKDVQCNLQNYINALEMKYKLEGKKGSSVKNSIIPNADVHNYNAQIGRTLKQHVSLLDTLAFEIIKPENNRKRYGKIKMPDQHQDVIEDFLSGVYEYVQPLLLEENSQSTSDESVNTRFDENHSHNHAIRCLRPLLSMPFIKLKDESVIIRELRNILEDINNGLPLEAKAKDQFEKMVRNAQFQLAQNRPYREPEGSPLNLALQIAEVVFTKGKGMNDKVRFLLPAFLQWLPLDTRSVEQIEAISPTYNKLSQYLLSTKDFIELHTNNGILYHGTDASAGLSVLRGGFIVSTDKQGTAAYGPGVYTTPHKHVAGTYSGSEGIVLPISIASHNIKIIDWINVPDTLKKTLEVEARESNYEHVFELLRARDKYGIDVIVHEHVIIQNQAAIVLDQSMKLMFESVFNTLDAELKQDSYPKLLDLLMSTSYQTYSNYYQLFMDIGMGLRRDVHPYSFLVKYSLNDIVDCYINNPDYFTYEMLKYIIDNVRDDNFKENLLKTIIKVRDEIFNKLDFKSLVNISFGIDPNSFLLSKYYVIIKNIESSMSLLSANVVKKGERNDKSLYCLCRDGIDILTDQEIKSLIDNIPIETLTDVTEMLFDRKSDYPVSHLEKFIRGIDVEKWKFILRDKRIIDAVCNSKDKIELFTKALLMFQLRERKEIISNYLINDRFSIKLAFELMADFSGDDVYSILTECTDSERSLNTVVDRLTSYSSDYDELSLFINCFKKLNTGQREECIKLKDASGVCVASIVLSRIHDIKKINDIFPDVDNKSFIKLLFEKVDRHQCLLMSLMHKSPGKLINYLKSRNISVADFPNEIVFNFLSEIQFDRNSHSEESEMYIHQIFSRLTDDQIVLLVSSGNTNVFFCLSRVTVDYKSIFYLMNDEQRIKLLLAKNKDGDTLLHHILDYSNTAYLLELIHLLSSDGQAKVFNSIDVTGITIRIINNYRHDNHCIQFLKELLSTISSDEDKIELLFHSSDKNESVFELALRSPDILQVLVSYISKNRVESALTDFHHHSYVKRHFSILHYMIREDLFESFSFLLPYLSSEALIKIINPDYSSRSIMIPAAQCKSEKYLETIFSRFDTNEIHAIVRDVVNHGVPLLDCASLQCLFYILDNAEDKIYILKMIEISRFNDLDFSLSDEEAPLTVRILEKLSPGDQFKYLSVGWRDNDTPFGVLKYVCKQLERNSSRYVKFITVNMENVENSDDVSILCFINIYSKLLAASKSNGNKLFDAHDCDLSKSLIKAIDKATDIDEVSRILINAISDNLESPILCEVKPYSKFLSFDTVARAEEPQAFTNHTSSVNITSASLFAEPKQEPSSTSSQEPNNSNESCTVKFTSYKPSKHVMKNIKEDTYFLYKENEMWSLMLIDISNARSVIVDINTINGLTNLLKKIPDKAIDRLGGPISLNLKSVNDVIDAIKYHHADIAHKAAPGAIRH